MCSARARVLGDHRAHLVHERPLREHGAEVRVELQRRGAQRPRPGPRERDHHRRHDPGPRWGWGLPVGAGIAKLVARLIRRDLAMCYGVSTIH